MDEGFKCMKDRADVRYWSGDFFLFDHSGLEARWLTPLTHNDFVYNLRALVSQIIKESVCPKIVSERAQLLSMACRLTGHSLRLTIVNAMALGGGGLAATCCPSSSRASGPIPRW